MPWVILDGRLGSSSRALTNIRRPWAKPDGCTPLHAFLRRSIPCRPFTPWELVQHSLGEVRTRLPWGIRARGHMVDETQFPGGWSYEKSCCELGTGKYQLWRPSKGRPQHAVHMGMDSQVL
jgi:hypothetical protein